MKKFDFESAYLEDIRDIVRSEQLQTREQRKRDNESLFLYFCIFSTLIVIVVVCCFFAKAYTSQTVSEQLYTAVFETSDLPVNVCEEPVQEDFENDQIESALLSKAHTMENCTVTYYCCEQYDHICNAGYPYKTCTGSAVVPDYTCAVDPCVIPLGSTVMVDYGDGIIHTYLADDIGGAVTGGHIDLATDTHAEALEMGVRTATVYWVEADA